MRLTEIDHVLLDVLGGKWNKISKVREEGVTFVNCQDSVRFLFDFDLNDYVARDYFQEFERQNITEADYRVVFICGIPEVYLNARGFLKLLVNSPSPVAKYKLKAINTAWLFEALKSDAVG